MGGANDFVAWSRLCTTSKSPVLKMRALSSVLALSVVGFTHAAFDNFPVSPTMLEPGPFFLGC